MKTNLLLLFVVSCNTCLAQSAKDYFFPASGKNLSVYVRPAMGDTKGAEKTLVYYKDMGDSAVITTVYPEHNGKIGWKAEVVKIEDSKISLRSVTSNIYKPQNFEADEMTLLEIPTENNSTSAFVKGSMKQTYKAEFLMMKVDGKKRKALRITQKSEMNRSGREIISHSDYFVAGVGFYKRMSGDVQIEKLEEQKFDPNPPIFR